MTTTTSNSCKDFALKCAVVEKNFREVVRLLCEGANPNIPCSHADTLLEYVMLEMDTTNQAVRDIANRLIQHGGKVDSVTLYRATCTEIMIWYVQTNFTAMPEMLEELFLSACGASELYDTLPLLNVCVALGVNTKVKDELGGAVDRLWVGADNYEEILGFLHTCGAI